MGICGRDDFFALYLHLGGKLDICGRKSFFLALHLHLGGKLGNGHLRTR